MRDSLAGRSALITGGTQGLGLEIARAYLEAGAAGICVCGRDAGALERASEELGAVAAHGQRVLAVLADVSVPADVRRLVDATVAELPDLTILVSNAGIYGPKGAIDQADWSEWVRAIEVNLFGSVLIARAVMPHFVRHHYGKIVQLSGGGATGPLPGLSAYAASKAAVVRFAETLASELREHRIDVNSIAPGALNTRMLNEVLAAGPEQVGVDFHERALAQQRSGGVPLRRGAELAVFLGSPDSDGITGKLLSAVWDPWSELSQHSTDLESDVYTLRRIVPADRGLAWGMSDAVQPAAVSAEGGAADPALRLPPGRTTLPRFDRGWCRADGGRDPYLSYVGGNLDVNWSAELEELHMEDGRDHFLAVWNRRAMIDRMGHLPTGAVIVDLGCASGYLLHDLREARPDAQLIGVDLVESGLRVAHTLVPDARLLHADVCALPLNDASIDLAVSANLLEHVPDDLGALAELYRVLRPGASAVLVVPAGPSVYDYYDRYLGHERRYARGELGDKARSNGLEVIEESHLGSMLYPPFWLVKKRNRLRYRRIEGPGLKARVLSDIANTADSRVGHLTCAIERGLVQCGVRIPFGIRSLTVVRRPATDQ